MRLAAVILISLAAPAAADSGYWDSVLARGILADQAPCTIAQQDARNGAAPYLPPDAWDGQPVRAITAAQVACLRNLGAWGLDPVAAAQSAFAQGAPDS